MRCNCDAHTLLIKSVEGGGLLLRGNAPIIRIKNGRMVVEQRCPNCRRLTHYSPLAIRLSDKERHGDRD